MANWLNLFNQNQGPSPQEKEMALIDFVDDLPLEELTRSRIARKALELGFRDPVKGADWAIKGIEGDRKRLKEMIPDVQGQATRQFLEGLPEFAPRFDPSRTSVPIQPEELTALVSSAAGGLPKDQSMRFLESARGQDIGNRLQVTAPLQGFENLPPAVRDPIALEALKKQFLPTETKLPGVGTDLEGIALSLYDRPFGDITPSERENVRQIDQQEKIRQRAAQGAGTEIAKLNVGLRKQRSQMSSFVSGIDKVQNIIQADPAVLGVPGALSRSITSIADQAKAMANLIVPGAYEEFHKVERYANIFRDSGIKSAELQSRLLGLSIAMALAEGFQDRGITDRKIELNLNRLTGAIGSGSAEIAFRTLEELKQEVVNGYNTTASATGANIGDVLGPVPLLTPPRSREFFPSANGGIEILIRRPAP